MRLTELGIEAFRSICNNLTIRIQDQLTCLIGANESGKSNILNTIPFLTSGEFGKFDRNTSSQKEWHPRLTFTLRLNSSDRRYFVTAITEDIKVLDGSAEGGPEDKTQSVLKSLEQFYSSSRKLLQIQMPGSGLRRIVFGNGGRISVPNQKMPALSKWFRTALPRIVLFEPSHELSDTISLAELEQRHNVPFEGLLKLAEVWDQRDELFEGDLNAHRLHDKAGRTLTRKLRKKWTQGSKLQFQFHAAGERIAVRIKDPVTFDTPSIRSLGFRSFLSFNLTLFAETEELDPEGFILLFDEPGLHLHPQGQKDLLAELRTLALKNQVIYATHSPFLIDRNDLASVLLTTKGTTKKDRGTHVTYKPYGDNWRRLTDALGIVPSDAFFPPDRTLVVEGTSDRIYVTTFMAALADNLKVDLNYLFMIDADRRDELPGIVRLLVGAERTIVVAADGDKGGEDFEKHIRRVAGGKKSNLSFLDFREITGRNVETAIEDLIPIEPWNRAIDQYVKGILNSNHVVDHGEIFRLAEQMQRSKAAGQYLVTHGLLNKPGRFSRTTVAHLVAESEIAAPDRDAPIYQLCAEIAKALKITR